MQEIGYLLSLFLFAVAEFYFVYELTLLVLVGIKFMILLQVLIYP